MKWNARNGMEWNGMEWNGMEWNEMKCANGSVAEWNGSVAEWNAILERIEIVFLRNYKEKQVST